MSQRGAVIEAMRSDGEFATLGHLCKQALKKPEVNW